MIVFFSVPSNICSKIKISISRVRKISIELTLIDQKHKLIKYHDWSCLASSTSALHINHVEYVNERYKFSEICKLCFEIDNV